MEREDGIVNPGVPSIQLQEQQQQQKLPGFYFFFCMFYVLAPGPPLSWMNDLWQLQHGDQEAGFV